MAILVYLMKTTVVFVALFSLYNIFLKNITFLRLRRCYLTSTLLLSFLIPWVSPFILPNYYHPEPSSALAWIDEAIRHFVVTNWLLESWGRELINVLMISILGAGFVLVTARYAVSLGKVFQFLKGSHVVSKNKLYTLRTGERGEGNFCFLKTIYLCGPSLNEQNINVILEHEKSHIRQKHYIDMWLLAMCDYFIWLCPFTKQFKAAWEEVLECMADREAIETLQIEPIAYQSVLYSNMEYSNIRTVLNNGFGRSMIAKRLLFISQKPNCIGQVLPRMFFSLIAIGVLVASLAFIDVQMFQLQKINAIRNAGYDIQEVTTGYVVDSYTDEPVSNVTVRNEDAVAVTDNDGFFFIEKSPSKLSVQHIAYNKKNTAASNDLVIKIEPSIHSIASTAQAQANNNPLGRVVSASFSSGKAGYDKYISQNMKYPERALINKINGTVWVKASIGADGEIKKVQLQQGINTYLDQEAIRLVKNMPKWRPALQNNIQTEVQVLLPVPFK